MRYPRELIEEIRMQNDIVDVISQYVPLKQKGSSYFGLCPFHHEKTPSFSVNSEKQFYYCFGCGASGNVYGFLMEMENCDFPEARQYPFAGASNDGTGSRHGAAESKAL